MERQTIYWTHYWKSLVVQTNKNWEYFLHYLKLVQKNGSSQKNNFSAPYKKQSGNDDRDAQGQRIFRGGWRQPAIFSHVSTWTRRRVAASGITKGASFAIYASPLASRRRRWAKKATVSTFPSWAGRRRRRMTRAGGHRCSVAIDIGWLPPLRTSLVFLSRSLLYRALSLFFLTWNKQTLSEYLLIRIMCIWLKLKAAREQKMNLFKNSNNTEGVWKFKMNTR